MNTLSEFAAALDKKRISVDQCFLSTMVKGDPKSQKLLAALETAHDQGRIICPIHLEESIFESSFLSEGIRQKIFSLQNRLSGGCSFHSFAQQLRTQTFLFLEPNLLLPSLRQATLKILPGTDFAAMAKQFQAGKNAYVDRLNRMPYPPASYKRSMSADQVAEKISEERSASMFRILDRLRSHGTIDTGQSEWEYTVAVGEFLQRLPLTPLDASLLMDTVLEHRWEQIPYLWAHSQINAQIELGYLAGHKKATPNDLLDMSRIAVALNDAAVLLCDSAMAAMIRQSGVLKILDTVKVFSMKQRDEAADYIAAL